MNKKNIIKVITIFVIIIVFFLIIKGLRSNHNKHELHAIVKKGAFNVTVNISGEVDTKNAVKVYGPQNIQLAGVWNIKITDMVAEGSIVKKGDFIAQLDQTEVKEGLMKQELELEERLLMLNRAKIDTAINLQKARNNLDNLKATMLEKELEVEKSVYEPPVIIKQAQAEYERFRRQYEQAQVEYKLSLTSSISKVKREMLQVEQRRRNVALYSQILKELKVLAPKDGMVIYRKNKRGDKYSIGSMISAWDLVVAELPDLTQLISITYVNEVDIRKVKVGQTVNVTFDAFPEKSMKGKVYQVANVGSTLQGGKIKVFQVDIEIMGFDNDIKPGMTTGNAIITYSTDKALFLPIETVFSQGDSLQYVFIQKKFSVEKREVKMGKRNDQDIIILEGLNEGDEVRFLPPENSDDLEVNLVINNKV